MFARTEPESPQPQAEQRYRVRRRRELTKELPPGARYRLRRAPTLMVETELFTDQQVVLPAVDVIKQCETQSVELNKTTLHYAQPYQNFTLVTSHAISPKTASESVQSRSWVRRGLVREASLALQIAARTTLLSIDDQPKHGAESHRTSSFQPSTNSQPTDLGIRGVRSHVNNYVSRIPSVSNLDSNVLLPRQRPESRIKHDLPREASARLHAGLSEPSPNPTNCYALNPATLANRRLPFPSRVGSSSSQRHGVAPTHDGQRNKAASAPIFEIAAGNTSHKRDMFEQIPGSGCGIQSVDKAPSVAPIVNRRHTIKNSMRECQPSVYSHNRTDSKTSSITMVQSPGTMSNSSWERKSSLFSIKEKRITHEPKLQDTQSSFSDKAEQTNIEPEAHASASKDSSIISNGTKELSAATASPEKKLNLKLKTTKLENHSSLPQKQNNSFTSIQGGSTATASVTGHGSMIQDQQVTELPLAEARLCYPLKKFVQGGHEQNITVRDFALHSVIKEQTGKESDPKNEAVESETEEVLQERHTCFVPLSDHTPSMSFWMESESSKDPSIDLFAAIGTKKVEKDHQDEQTPSSLQPTMCESKTVSQCMAPGTQETNEKEKQISPLLSNEHKLQPTTPSTTHPTREATQNKGKERKNPLNTNQKLPRKAVNITRSASGKHADYTAPSDFEEPSDPPRASKMPRFKIKNCSPLPPTIRTYYKTTRVFSANQGANSSKTKAEAGTEAHPPFNLHTTALDPQNSTPYESTSPPNGTEQDRNCKRWPSFGYLVGRLARYLQQWR